MLEETITIRHHCSKPPNLVAHMHLQLQAQPVVSHSHGVEQLQRKAVISGSSHKIPHSTNPLLSTVSLNSDQILLQMVNLGRRHRIQDFYLGKYTKLWLNQVFYPTYE